MCYSGYSALLLICLYVAVFFSFMEVYLLTKHRANLCVNVSSLPYKISIFFVCSYAADNRFDRALSIYLRIQHEDTFELIRKHKLYKALQVNSLVTSLSFYS